MNPPTLPAAPWQPFPLPDSRAVITGDGYFLLNLEGLDATPEQAAALRRAVAALPDLLAALADCLQSLQRTPDAPGAYRATCMHQAHAALLKAGFTDTQPPPPCEACHGSGQKEIQSGPYFQRCEDCGGTGFTATVPPTAPK